MTPNPTFRCMRLQCSSFIMHNKSQSSKGIYSQNAKYNDVIYQLYQFFLKLNFILKTYYILFMKKYNTFNFCKDNFYKYILWQMSDLSNFIRSKKLSSKLCVWNKNPFYAQKSIFSALKYVVRILFKIENERQLWFQFNISYNASSLEYQ